MKKISRSFDHDIIIIGAGPAGLSLAAALDAQGLDILVVEKSPEKILRQPPEDGRDIALTHRSENILKDLGIWQRFPKKEVSPIREARVLDGTSPVFLQFADEHDGTRTTLGHLVPNYLIRKAAYQAVKACKHVTLLCGIDVKSVKASAQQASVVLSDGTVKTARLLVAADSRFSEARRKVGISTEMKDFGRSVIVCRVVHEKDHGQIAFECFHYGQTLAVLPLQGKKSSIVITITSAKVNEVMGMNEKDFSRMIEERFKGRLGKMKLISARHPYPLVGVYADDFTAPRFALLGDAAVGMHPVTAHGFNFGLAGVDVLTAGIKKAQALGLDIGSRTVLDVYNKEHRKATRPLYLATNALVGLYTRESRGAKILRKAVLHAGQMLTPARKTVVRGLMARGRR